MIQVWQEVGSGRSQVREDTLGKKDVRPRRSQVMRTEVKSAMIQIRESQVIDMSGLGKNYLHREKLVQKEVRFRRLHLKPATHQVILYADRSEFDRQRKSRANFAID